MTKNFRSLKPGDFAVFTAPNGDSFSVTVISVTPEGVCVTWPTSPNTFKSAWTTFDSLVPFGDSKFLAI